MSEEIEPYYKDNASIGLSDTALRELRTVRLICLPH